MSTFPPAFRPGRTPRRRRLTVAAITLAIAALLGSALAPGGLFTGSPAFSERGTAAPTRDRHPLAVRFTKVLGTSIPAKVYGTDVGRQEDQGVNARGQLASEFSPIPAAAFRAPVTAYKRYAAAWIGRVGAGSSALTAALRTGSRAAAQAAWARAWSAYLHLGAVYGLFGALDQRIDGMPGGLIGGSSSPRFSGLHRIEMGLWDGSAPRSLVRYGVQLSANVSRLRRVLPRLAIDPLDYATRTHEILEDAQRDLMSGLDVPWSGEGVLGTAAGVDATAEVVHTLSPLLGGRGNAEVEVDNELLALREAIAAVRRQHGGAWPTLAQLTAPQRERLNGTLAGALGALAQLPGTLETKPITEIPPLPAPRRAPR
jgi:hypothetical protein